VGETQPADDPQLGIEKITGWLESNVGRVTSIARQERWRPAWLATVEREDGPLNLYVRADRGAGLETRPLSHEYAVLRLLERNGIKVPRLYGWCDDPEAIVMAALDDHPFHGGADSDAALHRIVQDYVAILARIHRIPLDEVAAAGIEIPTDPKSIALAYFRLADKAYQAGKAGPEPLIEFLRGWTLRNIPMHRTNAALLVADAPQFFHDGRNVTAIYDLEMSHVGDPMMELASIRVRDINEPIGDMPRLLQRYVEEAGEAVDWAALDFHTLVSFLAVPMMTRSTFRTNHPHPAFVEYLSWDLATSRAALEVLAETLGLSLDTVGELPARRSIHTDALTDLVAVAEALPPPDGLLREAPALSLARYALRADAIGPEIERLERAETEELLGRAFPSSEAAEEALEALILAGDPGQDGPLTRFFHCRVMRRLQLICDYPAPIVTRGLGRTRGN
jgi:aminoglycoside phosphotransferase (APT) family kinase protein